jgi:hypothetical protein
MVFRKRGRILPTEQWNYNGQNIEVVNDFNHLGSFKLYAQFYIKSGIFGKF